MRVALVGWDMDAQVAGELARLGAEVVGFTRWFPDMPVHEVRDGWTLVRCPHRIGGMDRDEAGAFAIAVVREASTSGTGFASDVVHALDRRSRAAAAELASRIPGAALLASLGIAEEGLEDESGFGRRMQPRGWICDHPWVADRLRDRVPPGVAVRLALRGEVDGEAEAGRPATEEGAAGGAGPRIFVSISRRPGVSPRLAALAFDELRRSMPGLSVAVFGVGPRAELVRRALDRIGVLAGESSGSATGSAAAWGRALHAADVVGVDARRPSEDGAARLAWLAGRPVVRLSGLDRQALVRALHRAIREPGRFAEDVEAGRALALRDLEPSAVAARWLGAYLDAVAGGPAAPRVPGRAVGRGPRLAFPELRSRLALTPISPREVLASWSLRREDWEVALEWAGPEAVRSRPALRLFDVTDLSFDGRNAHSSWDVELGYGEGHRAIPVPRDGRSLAACLGLKTRSGHFHPLVHSRLCHLPREGLAPALPTRRMKVVPRRDPP
ncbi:hypothetical protein OJF2_47150 [Aquisphaera giovannonii]|uniref:Uncharacterized protein n=1 Tax=Aquisphaera giovannonii TaxID=406548 RepID=A0A5B9W7U1_9BACT|nr:DUF4912 domain-containing protein [Aquisphaera giovannonii]QEH36155.1 hypothetical protein OJF2_47150 [Aquisphaera giovannonii]